MFSIIIINYNTLKLTSDCIKSIFAYCQPGDFEIILVDNKSRSNEACALLQLFGERIKVIENKKNLGFAVANNQGVRLAKGEYLFFLNSDTLLNADILTPIKEDFLKNTERGIIGPRLLQTDGSEQAYSFGLDKNDNRLSWVSGAALIIRQDVFKEIGGWDERFFMYFEDVDLCRSTRTNGYTVERLPEISVTHLRGGSPLPFWRRKIYYYRAKILYFFKYL